MARLDGRRWSPRPEALVRLGITVPAWGSSRAVCQKNQIAPSFVGCLLLTLAGFVCMSLAAFAQTDVNDVHVQAHEVEKPKAPPKENVVTTKDGLTTRVRPLKVDVNLVLVNVTVTDGVVTLTGRPRTCAEGHDIVRRARHVQGVVAVRDRLDYPPPVQTPSTSWPASRSTETPPAPPFRRNRSVAVGLREPEDRCRSGFGCGRGKLRPLAFQWKGTRES